MAPQVGGEIMLLSTLENIQIIRKYTQNQIHKKKFKEIESKRM